MRFQLQFLMNITSLKQICAIAILNSPHLYNLQRLPNDLVDLIEKHKYSRSQTMLNLHGFHKDSWYIPRHQYHILPLSSQIGRNVRHYIYADNDEHQDDIRTNLRAMQLAPMDYSECNIYEYVIMTIDPDVIKYGPYLCSHKHHTFTCEGFAYFRGDFLFVEYEPGDFWFPNRTSTDIMIPAWYDVLAIQRNPYVDLPRSYHWTRAHLSSWDTLLRRNPYI